MRTASLQALLEEGVSSQVFPMAQAEVMLAGKTVFRGGAGGAQADTVFDLASLTKVMSTTALFLSLWEEKKVSPAEVVFGGVTVVDLLTHRSGLPAFVPIFEKVLERFPGLRASSPSVAECRSARDMAVRELRAIVPHQPPKQAAVYSDVGFMLLGEWLSEKAQASLDVLFKDRVAHPLGLLAHFRRRSESGGQGPSAPTGTLRPRPPAPGQEGLWTLPSMPSSDCDVDDDNAFVMDGVAGHAGLFGTCHDVARFGQEVLEGVAGQSPLAGKDAWQACVTRDTETPRSTRAWGFDTPSESDSSAGQWLGRKPPGAVGHLGFTGTSLWVDMNRQLVVALVSNRTFLGRDSQSLKAFRPRFHDEVIRTLSLE